MRHLFRVAAVAMLAAVIGSFGCRSEKPAADPAPDTQLKEGPVLAPPQQQSTPSAPQAERAAFPEGDPVGTAPAAPPIQATASESDAPTAQPTERDFEVRLEPTNTSIPAVAETAEAAKIKANLASLTNAEHAAVEKQKICPVSGEVLGTMGTPKKIRVDGKEVYICCPSCEEPLTSEPAKYLPKIGLQVSEQ